MDKPIRRSEVRLIVKPADASAGSEKLIPATVLERMFSTFLKALKAADAELHGRKHRSEFFISNLAMGSNVIDIEEKVKSQAGHAVDLFKSVTQYVYRSEFNRVVDHQSLANSIIAIGNSINEDYPAIAAFADVDVPMDAFFARQTERLHKAMSASQAQSRYFVGSAVGSFDGTLGNIDYRGSIWRGHLVLSGGASQIECVFDKSKGEDAYNPYGNKRVSVTGRGIYTGDSQLPERIEVFEVIEIPRATEAVDIRGSLTGESYFNADDLSFKDIQ